MKRLSMYTSRRREVEEIIALATQWTAGRQDVAALAVVGSWARGTATVDSAYLGIVRTARANGSRGKGEVLSREAGKAGPISGSENLFWRSVLACVRTSSAIQEVAAA